MKKNQPPRRGFFITGTDTSVGKTQVARLLCQGLLARGHRVRTLKPAETGCRRFHDDLLPSDALLLADSAASDSPIELLCPYRYALPLAPAVAAEEEGRPAPSFTHLVSVADQLGQDGAALIVEGAGGLLVPYTKRKTCADLVRALNLPLIIVARFALGTINHTLLTVREAKRRGLGVVGVVFNRASDPKLALPDPFEGRNPDLIAALGQVDVVGRVPYLYSASSVAAALFDWPRLEQWLAKA